jgi:hypothetical protein
LHQRAVSNCYIAGGALGTPHLPGVLLPDSRTRGYSDFVQVLDFVHVVLIGNFFGGILVNRRSWMMVFLNLV